MKYILNIKFANTCESKPNVQWLKFIMVTTEMVSSADDIARGFLSMTGGGLAAGLDAFSSKVLKTKNESGEEFLFSYHFVSNSKFITFITYYIMYKHL